MLPKKRRLTAAEVREVIATGKGVRSGVVSLKYVVKQGVFRASVVAPKSTAPKATTRNQLRRTLYHILATLSPHEKGLLENTMGVFFIRSIPTPLTSVLRNDISGIVKKLSHV